MAHGQRDAAEQAVEYLSGLGRPANEAKVLVLGTGCSGWCCSDRPCTVRSLRGTGALVDFYDANLPEAHCGGLRARGVRSLTPSALRRYDMVILQQPCSKELHSRVTGAARYVLDVRPGKGDCII